MHVVALASAAVPYRGSPRYRALAHLRREEGNLRAADEVRRCPPCCAAGTLRRPAYQRPLGLEDHVRGAIQRARCATGISVGCGATIATSSASSPAMSSGNSRCTGPGRSSMAIRKASRTMVGMCSALTIWSDILVSGLNARPRRRSGILPAGCHDRLLAGEHHHRHRAEQRVGSARRQVQRTRAERGDAHAGLAG